MRVIAGEAKGRKLEVPAGLSVRPTGARVRTSVFGMLEHRQAIEGARVLDLFAGSGSLGIEALSRGARELFAIEMDAGVAALLTQNIERCGFAARATVMVARVESGVSRLAAMGRQFDLALLDPPYGCGLIEPTLRSLTANHLLMRDAWVLVEQSSQEPGVRAGGGLSLELSRRHGQTQISLFRLDSAVCDEEESAHASS